MKKYPTRGFTLIEILVAAAMMAILVSLLLGFASQALTTWSRSSAKLEARSKIRFALELLDQDLESIVVFNDGREWFRSVPSPSKGRAEVGDWLMFYSVLSDPNTPVGGDLCVVSYRLALQDPLGISSNRPMYGLYRTVIPAGETFDKTFDAEISSLESFWEAKNPIGPEGFLVGHVVDFRVIYQYPDGARSEAGTTVSLGRLSPSLSVDVGPQPISVDVSITVISDKDAERLYSLPSDKTAFDNFIRRHGYTVSQRIPFARYRL